MNRIRRLFCTLAALLPLPATAAIVTIDVNDSNHAIQASDGLANNDSFQVSGIPFSAARTVVSPGGIASTTTELTISEPGDSVIVDLSVTQSMAGPGGGTDAAGAVTFNTPLPVLYYRVVGSFATTFDVGGVSFFELAAGDYSETDQVVGGNGTAWNFDVDGGPLSVSGLSYRFSTNAFGDNRSATGSADLRFIFSTNPIVVPLPGAAWMLGPALLALAARRRSGLGRVDARLQQDTGVTGGE